MGLAAINLRLIKLNLIGKTTWFLNFCLYANMLKSHDWNVFLATRTSGD